MTNTGWVPEVGSEVEVQAKNMYMKDVLSDWKKMTFAGSYGAFRFFITPEGDAIGAPCGEMKIRPLPTDEGRAVEDMYPIIDDAYNDSPIAIARALYRAGYRKQTVEPVEDMSDPANWRAG